MSEDELRRRILARRARFVAAAVASAGLSLAGCESNSESQVCLSIAHDGGSGGAQACLSPEGGSGGTGVGGNDGGGGSGGAQACLTPAGGGGAGAAGGAGGQGGAQVCLEPSGGFGGGGGAQPCLAPPPD